MTLICFGDSNTWGYDSRSYLGGRYDEGTRWPCLLSSALGAEVRELGENGRCVPHTAAEHSRALAELRRAAPADWLLVMLGGNDLLTADEPLAETPAARMELFLPRVRALPALEQARTLLIAPPPFVRGAWVGTDRLVSESRRLAGLYGRVAARLGISFLDAGALPLQYDGVHFTEEAHRLLAGKLAAFIRG